MTKQELYVMFDIIEQLHTSSFMMKEVLKNKSNEDSKYPNEVLESVYKEHAEKLSDNLAMLISIVGLDEMIKDSITE